MNKAKYLIAVLMVIVLSLACLIACMGVVRGSGKLETKEYDYSGFTSVEIGYAFEVEVIQSDSFNVEITADDNLFEYIQVDKRGDTLEIRLRSGYAYFATKVASITMPTLDHLSLSGASRGAVSGFSSSDSMKFNVSGASTLDIEDMEAGDTSLEISGASRVSGTIKIDDGTFEVSGASTVELDGNADDLTAEVSGASTLALDGFIVANADVEISGASNTTINTSGNLDITLSGASKLEYIGNPTFGRVDISGASSLNKK